MEVIMPTQKATKLLGHPELFEKSVKTYLAVCLSLVVMARVMMMTKYPKMCKKPPILHQLESDKRQRTGDSN